MARTKRREPPKRAADQTSFSISMPSGLLVQIDRRARELDMTRSEYLRHLARRDLGSGPEFLLDPKIIKRHS